MNKKLLRNAQWYFEYFMPETHAQFLMKASFCARAI